MPSIEPDFPHVSGAHIVDGRGQTTLLCGFCLGGWTNRKNFIIGCPGHAAGLRSAVERVRGRAGARFSFKRFLHHLIQEAVLRLGELPAAPGAHRPARGEDAPRESEYR